MNAMNVSQARAAKLAEENLLRERDLKNKRFALQLWRSVNGGVFVFFIFANYLMRQQQILWPPAGVDRLNAVIPTIISVGLLLSGLTATFAQRSIKQNKTGAMQRNILLTVALGIAFLIGIVVVWRQVPITGSYSAIFFTMIGFHALHVVVGMVLFGYVYRKAKTYSADNYWGVEAVVIFWHFVDLMWILYFIVLYML
jgi:cytochrome c oxidase subunit 3